jgi:metal-responsive CopG/Arc/MetJ family transcriptional regulator
MEKTSVQMEGDMVDDIDKIAELEEQNRSQVIRKVLRTYISEYKAKYGEKAFRDYKMKGDGT